MKKEAIAQKNPKSPISETFRILRTNIQFMDTNKKMKSLLITSTFPGEGKSWVTANLAITFAQAGKKVILVDADMRKGRQYAIFEVPPKPGLSNYLSKVEIDDQGKISENLNDYLQETEVRNLYLIPAGSVPPNPSELLVSAQMANLLNNLKDLCDIVIIDGTPCEILTDSVILSRIVDTTVIVTAYKKTKKDLLEKTIKNIRNVGGNIAGVVLNKVPSKIEDQYYYRKKETKFNPKGILKSKKTKNKNSSNKSPKEKKEDLFKEDNIKKMIEEQDKNIEKSRKNENKNKKQNIENKNKNKNRIENENRNKKNYNNEKKKTNTTSTFDNKSDEILKQINEYINNEKKKK